MVELILIFLPIIILPICDSCSAPCWTFARRSQRVKTQKGKHFSKLRRRKESSQKKFQKISQKIDDITLIGFWSISGNLRNLRGRLLSSEKFSEVFTLWLLPLKPFPVGNSCCLFSTLRSKGPNEPCSKQKCSPPQSAMLHQHGPPSRTSQWAFS